MDYDLIATDLQRRALDKLAAVGVELTLDDRRLVRAEKQRLGLTKLLPTKSAGHWVETLMMFEQWTIRYGQPSRTSDDPIARTLANCRPPAPEPRQPPRIREGSPQRVRGCAAR